MLIMNWLQFTSSIRTVFIWRFLILALCMSKIVLFLHPQCKTRPVRLSVRTHGFHPCKSGSIPLRATFENSKLKKPRKLFFEAFFLSLVLVVPLMNLRNDITFQLFVQRLPTSYQYLYAVKTLHSLYYFLVIMVDAKSEMFVLLIWQLYSLKQHLAELGIDYRFCILYRFKILFNL